MIARLEAERAGAPALFRSGRALPRPLTPFGPCLPPQFHLPHHLIVDDVCFLLCRRALIQRRHG
jgi:hypothetical protein